MMPHKQGEKMRGKKGLLFSFVTLILALGVFATVMFAWYSSSQATSEFMLETGNIDANVTLYRMSEWDGSSKYTKVTEVVSTTDASKIFSKLVPGQVVTLALKIEIPALSNVDATYTIDFGKFYTGTYNKDTSKFEYNDVEVSSVPADPTIFKAIKVQVFVPVNGSSELVYEDFTADTKHPTVYGFKINADTDPYAAVATAKPLSTYITTKQLFNGKNGESKIVLTPGTTQTVIIKFYFDPTEIYPADTGNSNPFAHKCIKISNLTINFEQVHKVIE